MTRRPGSSGAPAAPGRVDDAAHRDDAAPAGPRLRRGGRGSGRPPACRRRPATAASCSSSPALLIGLLFAISALALRAPATSASRAKAQLIDQIESRRAHGRPAVPPDHRPARGDQRRAGRRAAAPERGRAWPTTCAGSSWSPAPRAVTGPGLRLTLDDAPAKDASKNADANPRNNGEPDQGRVIARDLQIVVNGLWASGAEADLGQRPAADLQGRDPLRRPGDPGQLPAADPPLRHHAPSATPGAARRVRRERRRQLPAVAEDQLRCARRHRRTWTA